MVVKSVSNAALIAGFVIAIVVVGIAAFYAGQMTVPKTSVPSTITTTVTKTVGAGSTATATVTKTLTQTSTVSAGAGGASTYTPPKIVKAAWIYVGPVGDFGWTYAHDLGRRVVASLFKNWLQTTYVESVPEGQVKSQIETLLSKGYNVIFTTSYGYMEGTLDEAKLHPNDMFFHCSGYLRYKNMGTYFADEYQGKYLEGLLAGALTKTGHIAYVAAFYTPEVVRHLNAFAIGAEEMGKLLHKNITVYTMMLGAWYAPAKAKKAAETLVNQYNVDAIAYTEDSTAILQYSEQLYKQQHKIVYVFSGYTPGYIYAPDTLVSGVFVRWEVIYADILTKIHAGIYTPYNLQNVDYWYLMNTGAVDLGAWVYPNGTVMHINPKFIPELKSIKVNDPLTHKTESAYDYIMLRYELMKYAPMETPLEGVAPHIYHNVTSITIGGKEKSYEIGPLVDPFTGPLTGYKINNPSQKVIIPAGVRLGHDALWSMDWFVSWVKMLGKA